MEKNMYRREALSGAYSAAAYEASWYLRSILMGLLRGLIFSPFVYWYAVALRRAVRLARTPLMPAFAPGSVPPRVGMAAGWAACTRPRAPTFIFA